MADPYESLTLPDIARIIWQGKWLVICFTVLMLALALGYSAHATAWYKVDVVLKPMDSRAAQGLSAQLGGISALANIAGLGVSVNAAAESIAVLTSRDFTREFIVEQNLLPVLFDKLWDPAAGRWKSTVSNPPDIRDGIAYFGSKLRGVVDDRKTGLVTLTIEWTDPKLAARWADLLVGRLNEHMRQRALDEGQINVAYLKQELAASSLVPIQQSIGRVLENELQKLMLAKANTDFAFRIIDHAQVPKLPSRPQKTLICVGALLTGFFISVVYLLARHAFRQRPLGA